MTNCIAIRQGQKQTSLSKNDAFVVGAFSILIYLFFVLGAVSNFIGFNLIAITLFLIGGTFFDVKKTVLLLVTITPNSMVVCLSNSSNVRLSGVFYTILFVRLILNNYKVINTKILILLAGVVLICLSHIREVGIHDLALCVQIFIAIMTWIAILKRASKNFRYKIYLYFVLGIVLMFGGMLINKLIFDQSRYVALLDDPNYTSVAFAVLFSMSLYFFINRFERKNNALILLFSVLGGLMTGSRAFLLSVGAVVLLYCLVGLKNKRVRLVFFISLAAILSFALAVILKVPFAVKVYDETIGRTFELQNSYHANAFMDITSGRLFLWKYYLNELFTNPSKIVFGFGLNYYLVENGGYGLVAHNSIISGLMGFGVVGAPLIVCSYWFICRIKSPIASKKISDKIITLSILLAVFVEYFFLDGLLDIRLSMYLSFFVIAKSFSYRKMFVEKTYYH